MLYVLTIGTDELSKLNGLPSTAITILSGFHQWFQSSETKISLVIIVVFCLSKSKCRLQTNISYPQNEDNSKSVVVSASEHIYDAQSKGVQHKTMVKPALKAEGTRPR